MSGFDRKKKSIKYSIKGGVIIDANQMQTGKHPSCFADPWGQAKGKDCLPLL